MDNNAANLEVSKEFQCSKEQLFKAWTDPEQLKKWWKPMGKQLVEVVNDLTEGGDIRYVFEDNVTIDGKYEKVSGNNLLEYTWNWHFAAGPVEDASYKLSVKFEGDETGSAISIKQESSGNAESIQPNEHGWEQGLEQLAAYANNRGEDGDEPSLNGQQKPPVTGYNETPEQLKVAGG
jgi:uncharacterized protein YndB with AHSA1/START domain